MTQILVTMKESMMLKPMTTARKSVTTSMSMMILSERDTYHVLRHVKPQTLKIVRCISMGNNCVCQEIMKLHDKENKTREDIALLMEGLSSHFTFVEGYHDYKIRNDISVYACKKCGKKYKAVTHRGRKEA